MEQRRLLGVAFPSPIGIIGSKTLSHRKLYLSSVARYSSAGISAKNCPTPIRSSRTNYLETHVIKKWGETPLNRRPSFSLPCPVVGLEFRTSGKVFVFPTTAHLIQYPLTIKGFSILKYHVFKLIYSCSKFYCTVVDGKNLFYSTGFEQRLQSLHI